MGSTAPRRHRQRLSKIGPLVVAIAAALTVAAVSWADDVVPDGDVVTAGDQAAVNLGTVSPGQVLTRSVSFRLVCDSKNHVDSGQSFGLNFSLAQSTVPAGGSLSATNTSIGPVPASWPDDTSGGGSTNCPSPAPTPIGDNSDSTVTITAPTTAGPKSYTVRWNHSALSPAGDGDSNAVQSSNTTVTFTLTVSAADTTRPTSSASAMANGSPYTFGNWTRFDVDVTLTGSDTGGSGLKEIRYTLDGSTPSASSGTVYSGPFPITSEGTTTLEWVAVDNAGNVETPVHSESVKVDKTPPTVNCGSPDGVWHITDVSIACTASDGGSGLASNGDASFNLSTSVSAGTETANAATGSRSVSDVAGNTTTAGPIGGNRVDKKNPTILCTGPDDSVWHGDNVTVDCAASDGGSGLASPGDASFSLSTSVAAGGEDATASTGSKTVADAVGNDDTMGPFTFKVDRKAPQLAGCDSPDGAWHATDVTLHCTYADGGSGPASQQVSLSTNVSAGTETANAAASAGGAQACDDAGNCAASPADIAGNKVDKKAPALSCGAADGNWHANDVSIACSASDGGSGVAPAADETFSLTTNVAAGTETSNASTGSKTVGDAVGNSATAGPVMGNKVDKRAPDVSLSCAPAVVLASSASASWTANDGGSGVKAGHASGSVALDTGSIGSKTATVPAGASEDNVGNLSAAVSCSYSVIYGTLVRFLQPINYTAHDLGNSPDVSTFKAGSTVPVKVQVKLPNGTILQPTSVLWITPQKGGATSQPVDETVYSEPASSGTSYVWNTDQFSQYNWGSPKTGAGFYWLIGAKLDDGQTYKVYVSLR
jgi:Chitobiase/beta-hexosaminidase C-terminal domain